MGAISMIRFKLATVTIAVVFSTITTTSLEGGGKKKRYRQAPLWSAAERQASLEQFVEEFAASVKEDVARYPRPAAWKHVTRWEVYTGADGGVRARPYVDPRRRDADAVAERAENERVRVEHEKTHPYPADWKIRKN
jgi:hypothetical protein